MLFRPAVLVALTMVAAGFSVPLAPAVADSPVQASFARHLEAAGLTRADVPALVEVLEVDSSGRETAHLMPLDDALALFETPATLAVDPPGGHPREPGTNSHLVVGGVRHVCNDGIRICYVWNSVTPVHAVNDTRNRTAEAWEGAAPPRPLDDFPVAGGYGFRIWGKYWSGVHVANRTAEQGVSYDNGALGEGRFHGDRSIHGVGVGKLYLFKLKWGSDLWISYGRIDVHGVFTFCERETTPECDKPGIGAPV